MDAHRSQTRRIAGGQDLAARLVDTDAALRASLAHGVEAGVHDRRDQVGHALVQLRRVAAVCGELASTRRHVEGAGLSEAQYASLIETAATTRWEARCALDDLAEIAAAPGEDAVDRAHASLRHAARSLDLLRTILGPETTGLREVGAPSIDASEVEFGALRHPASLRPSADYDAVCAEIVAAIEGAVACELVDLVQLERLGRHQRLPDTSAMASELACLVQLFGDDPDDHTDRSRVHIASAGGIRLGMLSADESRFVAVLITRGRSVEDAWTALECVIDRLEDALR